MTNGGGKLIYLQLCKLRISLLASFSAASGFVISRPLEWQKIIFVCTGVFLLACGASALNQYQERRTDALMERTKGRPIPSGRIKPLQALLFSTFLSASGFAILFFGCNIAATILGLAAMIWYNGGYTYLKKVTAFAAIPGALTGSLPPAIGWAAGEGSLSSPALMALCLFFAIWQVPHFWLFLVNHGKEYEAAGLPSLSRIFRRPQLVRIIFHWITATAASGLILGLYGLAQSQLIRYALAATSVWLIMQGIRFILSGGNGCHTLFRRINFYMATVLLLLSSDSLSGILAVRNAYAIIASAMIN